MRSWITWAALALAGITPTPAAAQDAETIDIGLRLWDGVEHQFEIHRSLVSRSGVADDIEVVRLDRRVVVNLRSKGLGQDGKARATATYQSLSGTLVDSKGKRRTFTRAAGDGEPETAETWAVGRTFDLVLNRDGSIDQMPGLLGGAAGRRGGHEQGLSGERDELALLFPGRPSATVSRSGSWKSTLTTWGTSNPYVLDLRYEITGVTEGQATATVAGSADVDFDAWGAAMAVMSSMLAGATGKTERLSGAVTLSLDDGLPTEARLDLSARAEATLMGRKWARGDELKVSVRRLGSTGTRPPPSASGGAVAGASNEGLFGFLGANRAAVRAVAGEPGRTGSLIGGRGSWDSWPEHGLVYEYDSSGTVTAIKATYVRGSRPGRPFQGRLLGIRVGDDLSACERLWGRPLTRSGENGRDEWTRLRYRYQGRTIDVEAWRVGGERAGYGKCAPNTVSRIVVSR